MRRREWPPPMQLQAAVIVVAAVVVWLAPTSVDAGCYQRRLCCPGRNNTCKDVDDGIQHLPTVATYLNDYSQTEHSSKEYYMPRYESSGDGYHMVYPDVLDDDTNEKIGKLVLPDIVEIDGSGADHLYARYEHEGTTPVPRRLQQFVFGPNTDPDEPPEDITRYLVVHPRPKHLLIRYSILSQHLPLRVSTTSPDVDVWGEEQRHPSANLYYLEAPPTTCYCDDACVSLGDCCSDYTFVCPPSDCVASDWSSWSSCRADKNRCGIGTQQRVRHELEPRIRGGAQCPPLKEVRTCFVECRPAKSALDDVTTVALLLDYRYNTTRAKTARDNIYWDLPAVADKFSKAIYYCVHYKISWTNRNCVSPLLEKGLIAGSTICAECQPEAQLHRNNARCASDLEDGDEGFWKLIGPQSCNGIWTRLNRTDHCSCGFDYPQTHPFLLV